MAGGPEFMSDAAFSKARMGHRNTASLPLFLAASAVE